MPGKPNMTDALPTRRLLVADDEPDAAEVLAQLLRLMLPGWSVSVVHGGQAAVEQARRDPLDVVVLDIEMPVLGGAEAAAALRAEAQGAPLVLIAVSGNVSKVAAAAAGGVFDHALAKPVDLTALEKLIVLH